MSEKIFNENFAGNSLTIHQRTHNYNERQFKCTIFYLSEHIRRVLLGQKPYSCHECPTTFSRKEYLVSHQRSHNGIEIEKFRCNECSKTFMHKSSLNTHKLIHIGVERKVFPCNECGRKLARKLSLYQHKQIHQGYRPFKCDVCSKTLHYQIQPNYTPLY